MPSSVASTAAAAASVLAFLVASAAPALAQDFSITNQAEPPVQGHRNLMRQLQAWWDVHASYPTDAAAADEGGTVKIHLVIHPDGNIAPVEVVQGSGSCALDTAGSALFRGAFIHPFPADEDQQPMAMDLSLHYVLAHRHDQAVAANYEPALSRAAFTITNDPVKPTLVNSFVQKSCSGVIKKLGLRNHPAYGLRSFTTVLFYRKPNGSPMVKVWEGGWIVDSPVTQEGQMMHWMGTRDILTSRNPNTDPTRYTVWPDGDNHLIGDLAFPQGTVDLTCSAETVPPPAASAAWKEGPEYSSFVAVPPATTCRK